MVCVDFWTIIGLTKNCTSWNGNCFCWGKEFNKSVRLWFIGLLSIWLVNSVKILVLKYQFKWGYCN